MSTAHLYKFRLYKI